MHKNRNRALIAVALAAVMPLSVSLSACNNTPKKYVETGNTVTFNYNDGISRNYAVVAEEGETVAKPDNPIRGGFSFAGWYTETTGGTAVSFPYTPTDDVTFYAHWSKAMYTVTFNYNYGDNEVYETVTAEYGAKITAPANPSRDGYIFRYWSTTADGERIDFNDFTVENNITLYAKWRDENIEVYDIVLDYNNGTGDKAEYEIEQGSRISKSNANKATLKGYTLVGYAPTADAKPTDAAVIKIDKFPYTPTASGTLYAVWEKTLYTASFRYNYYDNPVNASNNGAIYERKEYYYQDTVEAPADPTREGYTFDGWYTLATNNGEKVEFPLTAEDRGANYYAHWKSNDVYTDILDAEYTDFDPTITWPGYSGGAQGNNCILSADVSGVRVDNYPANSQRPTPNKGFYVTFQYAKGSGLVFEFYATENITNASLIVNWGVELAGAPGQANYMTFGPTGENAYEIKLDGTALNYTPARVGGEDARVSGQFKSNFAEYTLMTGITLSAGKHTLTMIPVNDNDAFGGVLTSVAPMTDYIRFSYGSTGKIYWNPVYDNLDKKN